MTYKFRPSNGDEGDWFGGEFCDNCEHDKLFWEGQCDKGCKILAATLAFDIDDPRYPKEWIYDEGQPTCTKFERIK